MEQLIPALEGLAPTYLVGGAIRDLLRGVESLDLDLAVEGDAAAVGRELAARLEGQALEHERFGTATVRAGALAVDLAATRRERYPQPGALPVVEPAPLSEDLGRRDFSINAMAASLAPASVGRLHDPRGGLRDLGAGAVRVLHTASFVDDPTRLLRAVRYEARLDFAMDETTERLAREAVRGGALGTVSGPRIRDALLDLLAEPEVARAVERLGELGIDRGLHPALRADPELVAGAALGALDTGADRTLAGLAALVASAPGQLADWLESLGLGGPERWRVERAAARAGTLAGALDRRARPSDVHALLSPEPPEALALALGLGAPAEPILGYMSGLRHVRLEIDGDDLRAAGVPQSPVVGRALAGTLARKLDGEVAGREQELRMALELAGRDR